MMVMRVAVKVGKILSPVVGRANNKNITARIAPLSTATATTSSSSFGNNPCLVLYFKSLECPSLNYSDPNPCLKPLLPLAWSHDSLTTLKLICKLATHDGFMPRMSFHTALLWLHQNHPKTLACNIEAIVGRERSEVSVGCLNDFIMILYRLLLPEGGSKRDILHDSPIGVAIHKKGVLERYQRDPNYQFLHDCVSDVFAASFRSDFEKLKKKKPNEKMYCDVFSKASAPNVLGSDAEYEASTAVATILLCESIARKVFPREEEEDKDENEADYTHSVLNRLSKEVLEPVWKMEHNPKLRDVCKVKQYLEEVKADKSKIAADALLPHEILYYVVDPIVDEPYLCTPDVDYSDVAELQWKAMVEGLSNKGKLKNCLAVCGVRSLALCGVRSLAVCGDRRYLYGRTYYDVSVAMGILMSQLSDQEPWKGKVIPFTRTPEQLHLIQGNDLKSKRAFLRGMESHGDSTTTQKVLDLVLQKAVDANLEPERMIKKVLVFAESECYNMSSTHADHWPITYQAMRSKFEEKGYAVPHIVFWELCHTRNKIKCSQLSGMTTISGYSDNFLKLFLDREGDVGPDHVMEAAICGKEYQNLVVVD